MNWTEEKIFKLHKKYANNQETLESVWSHCQIVKYLSLSICENLAKKFKIKTDKKAIIAGSLVHDIGYYVCAKKKIDFINHGVLGYEVLKKEKFGEQIARFSLVHIGVGYKQNIPITLEEEIVGYADNFHSKDSEAIENFEKQKKKLEKFGIDKGIIMERFKMKFGVPKEKKIEVIWK